MKYAKNYTDAEDLLQDSFMVIFGKIEQYTHKGSFEGWMKRIVINEALQKYRSSVKKLEVLSDVEVQYDRGNEIDIDTRVTIETDVLLSLIQQLPNRYRLVFNLYVLDHFTHKDIAAMLNISEGTSKSNLSRARLILKKMIVEYQTKQPGA